MKKLAALVLLIIASAHAVACGHARQNRMFPVGLLQDGVAVVEMRLVRGEGADERYLKWQGHSFLVVYDMKHKEKSREQLQDLHFDSREYDKGITEAFRYGLKKARSIKGIQMFSPVSILFADYASSCSVLSLHNDTIKRSLSVKINNKKYPVAVLCDTNSIARSWFDSYASEGYTDFSEFYHQLGISSVRKFKVGSRELLVVHLGSGQTMYTVNDEPIPAGKEYLPDFKFNKLEDSAFEEPVMHHGKGFDFFIFL